MSDRGPLPEGIPEYVNDLPEYVADWLSRYTSTATRLQYAPHAKRLIENLARLYQKTPEEAGVRELSYILDMLARQSPTLYNQIIYAWRSLYEFMMLQTPPLAASNPARFLNPMPYPRHRQPMPRREHINTLWKALGSQKVWDACDDIGRLMIIHDRYIFAVMLSTGLRVTEICSLKRRDFDVAERKIRVMRKGGKLCVRPWHERSDNRILPLLNIRAPDEWMLPAANGKHIDRYALGQRIAKVGMQCGIGKFTPHAYRRYAIQRMADLYGAERARIFADHDNLATTQGYLQHGDGHDDALDPIDIRDNLVTQESIDLDGDRRQDEKPFGRGLFNSRKPHR